MSKSTAQPVETIRLSPRDRRKMIDELNSNSRSVPAPKDRRNLRVDYPVGQVTITVTHPTRQVITYNVLPRNLSRRGVSLVHGQFIYRDSPCEVMLQKLDDGAWLPIAGKVVGCRHLSGLLHEVSVAFKQPIDLERFVKLTAEQRERLRREIGPGANATTKEKSPPSDAVRQAIVVIEDAPVRQLTQLWLSQLGFEVRELAAGDAAGAVAGRSVDLVIVDLMSHSGKGAAIVRAIHETGKVRGLIAISADGRDAARRAAMDAGAAEFLELPITQLALQESIDRVCDKADGLPAATAEPLYPSLAIDPQMMPLLREFLTGLNEHVRELKDAVNHQDHHRALKVCQQVKGAGSSYGFEAITEKARIAMLSLDAQEKDLVAVRQRVDELTALMQRARMP